jgi:hypothetical protein
MVNRPRKVNPKQASVECEKLAMPGRSVSRQLTSGFAVSRPASPRRKGSFSMRSEIKTNLPAQKTIWKTRKLHWTGGGGGG